MFYTKTPLVDPMFRQYKQEQQTNPNIAIIHTLRTRKKGERSSGDLEGTGEKII